MRKTLLFLVLALTSAFAFCQDTTRFGVFIGLNETSVPMTYKHESYANVTQGGLSIGGVADIKLGKFLSFQPGLYYTRKGGTTNNDTVEVSTGIPLTVGTTKMNITYVEIPLNLLFNAKAAGATFFAGGGPYVATRLSTGLIFKYTDSSGVSPESPPQVNDMDFGYNILAGIRFTRGFTIRIAYEKSLGTIYDGQPGVKNQGLNFSAGYFFK